MGQLHQGCGSNRFVHQVTSQASPTPSYRLLSHRSPKISLQGVFFTADTSLPTGQTHTTAKQTLLQHMLGIRSQLTASAESSEDKGSSGCSSSPPGSLEGVGRCTGSASVEEVLEGLLLLHCTCSIEVRCSPPGPLQFQLVAGDVGKTRFCSFLQETKYLS